MSDIENPLTGAAQVTDAITDLAHATREATAARDDEETMRQLRTIAHQRDFTVRDASMWRTEIPAPAEDIIAQMAPLGEPRAIQAVRLDGGELLYQLTVLLDRGDALTRIQLGHMDYLDDRPMISARANVLTVGDDLETTAGLMTVAQGILPAPPDRVESERLPVSFWSATSQGPRASWRELAPIHWDAITGNYAPDVQSSLQRLMSANPDSLPARLHLWSGPPGTGKTHAVRALGSAWRGWCETHCVSDPEQFFGSADYMSKVIESVGTISDKWTLLILEDSGEFLTPDAPAAVGQGFSRLMNITDGMLGEGMRVILLLTTNTEIRKLHPAASRPGRAASNLTFRELDADSATAWLAARGVDIGAPRAMSLAELYALAEDAAPIGNTGLQRNVGFAAAGAATS